MIGMAQNPDDLVARMSASAQMPAMVDPHDSLTVPIGPAPVKMSNELGDPTGPSNELGDALPEQAEESPAPAKMSALAPQREHISKNLMADYQKDADPYGSSDNHPGFFGKLLHGLSHATGGDTRRGWEEQGLEKRLQDISKDESAEGLQGATQAHTEAETPEIAPNAKSTRNLQGATARNLESETAQRGQPSDPYMAVYRSLTGMGMPPQEALQEIERDKQMAVKPTEPKTTDIKGSDGKVHTMGYDDKTGKYDVDEGESGFRPAVTNVNAGEASLDREATRLGKPYEKGISDADAQLDKIADARTMINGNAEAQALGIPKVLTALVSGQGSGVRITMPELQAIATARGLSGDIQGTLNSWSGKGKLTSTQQKQLTGLLDDVKARITAKQQIHSQALDQINGASTRQDVIAADKQARQRLNDVQTHGFYIGQQTPKGKVVGFDGSGKVLIDDGR